MTESPVHPANRYRSVRPSAGAVVEIETISPSGCHPLPGVTDVPELLAIVRKYSVVKIAVRVFDVSATTDREGFTFPSPHAENEYRVPEPTPCGEGTRSTMFEFSSYQSAYGAVCGKPFTEIVRPVGVEAIVT